MLRRRRDKWYTFWRSTVTVVVFCVLFIIGSSSLGTTNSEINRCVHEGSYKFIHSRRLAKDSPCKFSNGARISHDSGYTILVPEEDGFSFTGGEGARWRVQASCENQGTPKLRITLENKSCQQEVLSSAQSTFKAGPEGEISINPYKITWTCGEKTWACEMIEAWELVPELW